MSKPRLVFAGACNVDFTFRAQRLPAPGETLPGESFHFDFGGKGANQSVAAARLGADVALISRVGDDDFGRRVLAQLANERIGAKFVTETPGFQTGAAAILLDAAGNNAIIGIPGACAAVTAADVRTAESVIRTASVVVSTLEIPGDAVATMFHLARQAGAITILNPAPVFSLPNEVLGLVDYWIPNEVELGMICGSPARELGEIESLGRKCLQRGPKNVIVTLGDRGAMYIREDETSLIPAERVSAVDSTGAGDTFIGCFATCLAIGFDPIAAIAHANRAAGVTVTRMGAQGALPYRTELGW